MKPTQQEIIELAHEAGFTPAEFNDGRDRIIERLVHLALERFGAGGGEPVLVVEKEPDYWSGGHFYKGDKPHIDPTKVWSLSIGTKLYTHPSPTDLQAAYARGLEDAASIVENADTPDCGGWTTCGIAEEIRALKGKQ